MKSAVSKYKLIISRVRNWLGLGAIYVAMIFVRRSRGNSKFSGCNVIDGLTTDISNMFSSKISSLLNSDLDLTNQLGKVSLLISLIPFKTLTC